MRIRVAYTVTPPKDAVPALVAYARLLGLDFDAADDRVLVRRLYERKGSGVDEDALEWYEIERAR